MQDSGFTFQITVKGDEQLDAAKKKIDSLDMSITKMKQNANGSTTVTAKYTDALKNQKNATDQTAAATDRAARAQKNWFAHITRTTIQSALVNKAFLGVVEAMGKAVEQVDTLANFPAVMQSMGLSAKDGAQGIEVLRNYVQQVNGDMAEATNVVTRFISVSKNIKASVAAYAGLNNALIAGGAKAEARAAALEQMVQAFSRGKPEAEEWKSILVGMAGPIDLVAKSMGRINGQQLGQDLRDGKVSMGEFLTELTKLSTNGGPIAKQAISQMQGIQFAQAAMKNALVNGLTAIYQAFGRQNIVAILGVITQAIGIMAQAAAWLMNVLINLVNVISRLFGGPVITNIEGELDGAAGAAANIGDNLSGGLKDAGKEAKKLRNQLASFDEMNVLTEPDDGGGSGKGAGGATGFDPGQIGELEGIFGNLTGDLEKAGLAAKILAGVVGGVLLNNLIKALTGVNLIKGALLLMWSPFRKAGAAAAKAVSKAWKVAMDPIARAAIRGRMLMGWDKLVEGMGKTIGRVPGLVGSAMSRIPGIISKVAPKLLPILGTLGSVFARVFTGPIGWITTIIGLLAMLFNWLYQNVEGFRGFVDGVVGTIQEVIAGVGAWISEAWANITTWISEAVTNVATVITDVWGGIVGVLSGPFQVAWQIISSIFILLVAIVAITLETIYNILVGIGTWIWTNVIQPVGKFFAGLWRGMIEGVTKWWNDTVETLKRVGDWIFKNVIQPVSKFFVDLWNTVSGAVVKWWNDTMALLKPVFTWIDVNVIQPIARIFKGLWDGITKAVSVAVEGIKRVWSSVSSWIDQYIVRPIAGFFSGLWDGIVSGVKAAVKVIKDVFNTIVGAVKAPINFIVDGINGVLRNLNKVKVPDWVPGIGGASPNFPMIPRLARGGVVNESTLANIGEDGAEVVMPLENNTEWIDMLASKLNGGSGGPQTIIVKIGEDTIMKKIIGGINDAGYMTNEGLITV